MMLGGLCTELASVTATTVALIIIILVRPGDVFKLNIKPT